VSETLRLLEALIACPSVTPSDAGCQAIVAERLAACGFECESMPFDSAGPRVDNLWAIHRGPADGPVLVLAGHLDVVPPGPLPAWSSDPFVPTYLDGRLHGRGAADMKTSVAAMVLAAESFVLEHPRARGSVALLLTSDEEGPAIDGTARVVEVLAARGQRLDACIVGEPTSVERLGDMIKNGRRGTLSGHLRVIGQQGHVAYPHLARNPLHLLAPALAELVATRWDDGNAHFPPTTFQVSNLNAGTGARNVVPGHAEVEFNFRFSTESTPQGLQQRVEEILRRHAVPHELGWTLGGEPFLTVPGTLSQALEQAIVAECGVRPLMSTTGGTSDGRFIARLCPQVIEFGPVNASIHQVDEWVAVEDVDRLTRVYRRTLDLLLA